MSDKGHIDTLIFGGGVAGLWTLRVLREAGFDAWLVETTALGAAQSMQAQGIVHGGGKYALRRVGDVEAIRQIQAMPDLWREHFAGLRSPSLADATLSSPECWLWLPRGSWRSRLEGWTLMPLLRHGGLLSCPPRRRDRSDWPEPLRRHALAAYSMAEPVFDPVSIIETLVAPVREYCLRARAVEHEDLVVGTPSTRIRLRLDGGSLELHARQVVACAGAGNAGILEAFGHDPSRMQRRPLRMGLVRGALPALHGHCVIGGKTRLTITSVDIGRGQRVWQVGGELAEQHAGTSDEGFFGILRAELGLALPGLSLSGVEFADYAAVRAEAANTDTRRPSGVQVEELDPSFILAWPTKWAMAPLLAAEVLELVSTGRARTDHDAGHLVDPGHERWPRASVGIPPWEQAEWRSANSAKPG